MSELRAELWVLVKSCLITIFMLTSIGHAFADVIYDAESEILFSEFIPCAKNGTGELSTGSVLLHAFVEKITNAPSGAGYSGTLKSTGGMLSGTVSGERYIAVKFPMIRLPRMQLNFLSFLPF